MPLSSILDVPESRRTAIARLAKEFVPGRHVVVTTHMNADGDACGSVAAAARLLAAQGLVPRIVNPTPWPAAFDFLLDEGVTNATGRGASAIMPLDLLLVLDVSDVKRLGNLASTVRTLKVPRLVVDHHVRTDEPAGDIILADTTACATGELLFDLAVTLGWEITTPIATALYTAILTDTGGFRFSNTSPRCHAVAAALLAAGVDPEAMYRRIYASVSLGRLHLLRDALDTLEVDADAGIAWIALPAEALDRHDVSAEDLDGIVEHPRSIAGTRLALFFRDLGHGKVKVSFRSTGDIDVNVFARRFGGGGHARAAGALLAGTLDNVRRTVVDAAREFVAQPASASGPEA
ncbi:MAG TPA: DHH family phosphoesterase [Gemmatimonadaceae bacterium]|nr:DHH family phosphoesterase [Gemmatimonadaceae bacterium]